MKHTAIVVGGGHAGVEAALALARRGHRTILVTARVDALGLMPCNPAIGGLAKSHLVVELDALGGEMGLNADLTGLQYRTLNASRGPAVRATRIQCDKQQYARRLSRLVAATPNLTLLCDRVLAIRTANGRVEAIETAAHGTIPLSVLVLTTGTALGGRIYLGQTVHPGGGDLRPGHTRLTDSLRAAGIPLKRLKTGTPPRLWSRSIDWSRLVPQPSDNPIPLFSLRARIARDSNTPFDTLPWNAPPSTWNNLNGYATHLLPHRAAVPPAGKGSPTLCTPVRGGLGALLRRSPQAAAPISPKSPSTPTPSTGLEPPSAAEPRAPLPSSDVASGGQRVSDPLHSLSAVHLPCSFVARQMDGSLVSVPPPSQAATPTSSTPSEGAFCGSFGQGKNVVSDGQRDSFLCTPTGAGLSPSCVGRITPLPLSTESPSPQTPPASPELPRAQTALVGSGSPSAISREEAKGPLFSTPLASVLSETVPSSGVGAAVSRGSTPNCSTWNNESTYSLHSAPFSAPNSSNLSHNTVDWGKTASGGQRVSDPLHSQAAVQNAVLLRRPAPERLPLSPESPSAIRREESLLDAFLSPSGVLPSESVPSGGKVDAVEGGENGRLASTGCDCSTWNNLDPVLPWIGLRVGCEGRGEVVGEGCGGRFAAPWQPGEVEGACYLTHTTERTHAIIRAHLGESAMYNGGIKGTGVRYCPSIEDKVVKFADKSEHHVVLEPEGRDCPWVYPNGLSNCLPFEVQVELVRSVPGLERAEFAAPGYAIEYDCIDSRALDSSLACRAIPNLFFAGQVNGTTGYEEAAAQGLMAGINAGRFLEDAAPVVLSRQDAYIGVLIDDLVVKGADEPYRMFTSRAERRLILRQDNAHRRLLKVSREVGLADAELLDRTARMEAWMASETARLDRERLSGAPLSAHLARPGVGYLDLPGHGEGIPPDWIEALEVELRYRGYVEQELRAAERAKLQEQRPIPPWLDYWRIPALRWESREKLHAVRPANLAQAAAVPGVTPADIAILTLVIKSGRNPA